MRGAADEHYLAVVRPILEGRSSEATCAKTPTSTAFLALTLVLLPQIALASDSPGLDPRRA